MQIAHLCNCACNHTRNHACNHACNYGRTTGVIQNSPKSARPCRHTGAVGSTGAQGVRRGHRGAGHMGPDPRTTLCKVSWGEILCVSCWCVDNFSNSRNVHAWSLQFVHCSYLCPTLLVLISLPIRTARYC